MHDVRENVVCILLEYRRQVRRRKDLGNDYYISAATTAAAPTMATVMRAVELASRAAIAAIMCVFESHGNYHKKMTSAP